MTAIALLIAAAAVTSQQYPALRAFHAGVDRGVTVEFSSTLAAPSHPFAFELSVGAPGIAVLRTHSWICPPGTYAGKLSPEDAAYLAALVSDLQNVQGLGCCCLRHGSTFSVEVLGSGWAHGTCTSLIPGSPFEPLYAGLQDVLHRTAWSEAQGSPIGLPDP